MKKISSELKALREIHISVLKVCFLKYLFERKCIRNEYTLIKTEAVAATLFGLLENRFKLEKEKHRKRKT